MKSLAATLRRRGGLILVVAVALAILWYGRRNRPERLGPRDPFRFAQASPQYDLHEDLRTHALVLSSKIVVHNHFQTLCSAPLPSGLHYDPMFAHFLKVSGDLIYFTLVKEAALHKRGFGYTYGVAVATGRRNSLTSTDPIIRRTIYQPSKEEIHVCCLAVKGGAIQDLLTGKGVTNIGITDDTIYWIDPRPEPTTYIETHDGTSSIRTPTSLLMATSLKTRQTHRIGDKVSQYIQFVPDHTAIFWRIYDNGPGYVPRTQLWYYAPDLAGPVHLTDNYMRGDGDSYNQVFGDKPIALGDRLYWMENRGMEMPDPTRMRPTTSRIVEINVVSVRRDGTQRRVILTLPVIADSPSFTIFAADRGRLYLGLTELMKRSFETLSSTTIYRLNPDSKQPLTRLFRLPNSAGVQRCYQGYIYYALPEEHNGFFGDEHTMSMAHYRWKLPDASDP